MKRYEIAIYAMYLLGRGQKVLDMEDIAMKCNEIAPGSFSWRKYKDQINLDAVRSLIKGAKEEIRLPGIGLSQERMATNVGWG